MLSIRAVPGDEDRFITATEAVLDASAHAGVPLLIVGGAGPLRSPKRRDLRVIDDPDFVPAQWREIAASSVTQLAACEAHANENWTYLSPPAILDELEAPGPDRHITVAH